MKRNLFYFLLIAQAIVLLLLGVQPYLTDLYGTEVKLIREGSIHKNYEYYMYDRDIVHIEYEINKLPADIWEIERELQYGERIYVVLEPDLEGIYHAVRATDEKPEVNEGQVGISGYYHYSDEFSGGYYVNYDIEEIKYNEQQYIADSRKQWIITIKIAPWGQKSVVNVNSE